ncbi:MAG: hypothetical protein BHV97_02560 [Clostridium sp. CAG:349_48_7]|nr:MAG: hypothetical protein BHV97_02560 [Clostridium sp. CAG:349_48_7]
MTKRRVCIFFFNKIVCAFFPLLPFSFAGRRKTVAKCGDFYYTYCNKSWRNFMSLLSAAFFVDDYIKYLLCNRFPGKGLTEVKDIVYDEEHPDTGKLDIIYDEKERGKLTEFTAAAGSKATKKCAAAIANIWRARALSPSISVTVSVRNTASPTT